MPETRRDFLKVAMAGAAAALSPAAAANSPAADAYPDKPIKLIVPAAAGSPLDIPARLIAEVLRAKLGQPVIVEDHPGAAGAIGTREVVKAAPDGYTLLCGGAAMLVVLPAVSPSAGYDPVTDFAPVSNVMEGFQILVVHPDSPWRTVKDLVADAKANPGKYNFAHIGTGHITHLAGEMFMLGSGVKLVGVPYRSGGQSVAAVLGRTVEMTFENVSILLPLIKQGKLRALAVTSRTRSALAPELPTMIEGGIPDYEVTTFFGILAPAGTPTSIVTRLNEPIKAALRTPEMQQTILRLGSTPKPSSPQEFTATIASQLSKWRALAQAAHITIG